MKIYDLHEELDLPNGTELYRAILPRPDADEPDEVLPEDFGGHLDSVLRTSHNSPADLGLWPRFVEWNYAKSSVGKVKAISLDSEEFVLTCLLTQAAKKIWDGHTEIQFGDERTRDKIDGWGSKPNVEKRTLRSAEWKALDDLAHRKVRSALADVFTFQGKI